MTSPITPTLLIHGGATEAHAALYAPHLATACANRGVTLNDDIASLLAEVFNESGNLACVHEVMSYTAARLCQVWPEYFHTRSAAMPYVGQPAKLGNLVYKALGGYADRGVGLEQITGRENFALYAADIGMPVSSVETYMTTPAGAADSAVWYFVHFGCRGQSAFRARQIVAGVSGITIPIGWPNVARLYGRFVAGLKTGSPAPVAAPPAAGTSSADTSTADALMADEMSGTPLPGVP